MLTGRFIAFRTAKERFLYLKTYMKKMIWKNFSTKEKSETPVSWDPEMISRDLPLVWLCEH